MLDAKELERRVEELCGPPVEAAGFEILLVEWTGGRGSPILRLYIDRPQGVTVEDCAEVSRLVGGLLDAYDVVPHAYRLEVSSPGLDRPLVRPEHFARFLGSRARVRVAAEPGARRNWQGVLVSADERGIVLDVDGRRVEIAYGDMERANLVPEWPDK